MAMTQNKGIGMTDQEWAEIVKKKAQDDLLDKRNCQFQLKAQREQLKAELDLQIQKRKDLDMQRKSIEEANG